MVACLSAMDVCERHLSVRFVVDHQLNEKARAREALAKKDASKDQVNEVSNEVDVTPEEFLQCLDKVRSFALTNGVSEDILKALSDLETQQGVSKKIK